jgi:ABC-2 type transport system permease protein
MTMLSPTPFRSPPLGRTVSDSATMLRRELKHQLRYPSVTVMLVGMPIVFLLLFVYVFGGTMGAGLAGPAGGRTDYVNYVVPGILVIAVAAVAQGTALSVAMDMTEGIVARFRTMAISRAAVLTGHVAGAMVQSVLAVMAVIAVALAVGFRASAGPVAWLATLGLVAAVAFALTWLTVAMGTVSKSVESASNTPMFLILLPFLSSAFVPTGSMPAGLAWFAEHQPFTPIVESVRGLLNGTPIGASGVEALAWCAVIALGGYLWARSSYDRMSVRA